MGIVGKPALPERKRKNMKKISMFLLAAALLVCLCACQQPGETTGAQGVPTTDPKPGHVHDYSKTQVETELTCTQNEVTAYICACGAKELHVTQEAPGHDYAWETTQELTCLQDEVRTGTCNVCGDVTTEILQEAAGAHDYDESGKCTACGRQVSLGLAYELSQDGKSYTVTGMGTCTDENLVIPEIHRGLPVLAIGDRAFDLENPAMEGGQEPVYLKTVEFSEGIKHIGSHAFSFQTELTEVRFADSIESIGEMAFSLSWLTEVRMPAGLKVLEANVFAGVGLEKLILNEGLTTIRADAFWTSQLPSLSIPNSVTVIEPGAFNMATIRHLEIGAGCMEIANVAAEIWDLEEVTLRPDNTAMKLQDGVILSADGTQLILYLGSREGSSYEIPETVTTIHSWAFYQAAGTGLKEIVMPAGVVKIGDYAFADLQGLHIEYRGTQDQWNAIEKTDLWYGYMEQPPEVAFNSGDIS